MARPNNFDRSGIESVAGDGVLSRRALLGRGVALAGAIGIGSSLDATAAAAEPLADGPWSPDPGRSRSRLSDALQVCEKCGA